MTLSGDLNKEKGSELNMMPWGGLCEVSSSLQGGRQLEKNFREKVVSLGWGTARLVQDKVFSRLKCGM